MKFLGIDLGASALKATMIDADGTVLAWARQRLVSSSPHAGWVEQAPHAWRSALFDVLTRLADDGGLTDVHAIAVSGGAHIAVLTDADGTPLASAIMWNDQRAHAQAKKLRDDATLAMITATSGNRPQPTWSLPQLIWRKQNQPDLMRTVKRIYFAKDWVRAQLTGDWMSDCTEGIGAMLLDLSRGEWNPQALELCGLTHHQMPPLAAPTDTIGTLRPDIAARFGMNPQLRVVQGAIDTSVEWLCCPHPSATPTASLKLASAGVVSQTTLHNTPAPPLSLYPHVLPELYYYASGNNNCMGALETIRTQWLAGCTIADMETAAANAPIGADNVIFHPYLLGERAPLWDSTRTATLSGLNYGHGRDIIARAAYEGVGFALAELIEHFYAHTPMSSNDTPELYLLGGGAQSTFWRQMLADILGRSLLVPAQSDASYAAARLAAQSDTDMNPPLITAKISPQHTAHAQYQELYGHFKQRRTNEPPHIVQ